MKIDGNDIIFFVGLIFTSTGLWLFNPALSLSIAGVILMTVGWLRAGGD